MEYRGRSPRNRLFTWGRAPLPPTADPAIKSARAGRSAQYRMRKPLLPRASRVPNVSSAIMARTPRPRAQRLRVDTSAHVLGPITAAPARTATSRPGPSDFVSRVAGRLEQPHALRCRPLRKRAAGSYWARPPRVPGLGRTGDDIPYRPRRRRLHCWSRCLRAQSDGRCRGHPSGLGRLGVALPSGRSHATWPRASRRTIPPVDTPARGIHGRGREAAPPAVRRDGDYHQQPRRLAALLLAAPRLIRPLPASLAPVTVSRGL